MIDGKKYAELYAAYIAQLEKMRPGPDALAEMHVAFEDAIWAFSEDL